MGKSLFVRMLFVYLLIIVISFTLMGGLYFNSLKGEYLDKQMDAMISNAQEINTWADDSFNGVISDIEFTDRLIQKAENEDTVIWLISSMGAVYKMADPEGKSEIEESFSSNLTREFFEITQQGKYAKRISDADSTFSDSVISIAIPLVVQNNIIGAIVVHREVKDFGVGISAIFMQVLIPLLISALIACMLVFILSRYIVKPIQNVSFGAAELSRGNLDWRVKPMTQDELGELAVSFNKMAEQLKLQDTLRNSFIANVSHELRTPLASIQGFIQGILDKAIEDQDRDKYLEVVLGETKRMNILISDLLSLAKIESGQFPIEISEFDINELIRRCIIVFEQRIEEKHLNVDVRLGDEKIIVWADEDRISQVITNLVDNAVKFSYDGGDLKIWTQIVESKVYVNVADTGEGVPPEEQPYVFERFYKVDKSHSRNKPGTGIGLSIVKRIISQHGEIITLQSVEGQGTTFTFSLTRAISADTDRPRVK